MASMPSPANSTIAAHGSPTGAGAGAVGVGAMITVGGALVRIANTRSMTKSFDGKLFELKTSAVS